MFIFKRYAFSFTMINTKGVIMINPYSNYINYTFLKIDHKIISNELEEKIKKSKFNDLI